ncbi:hypothetical protein FPV67DRAFT_1676449 [Lyophyllum atratum]|nr:hypothetical protein FPV67DRAFT_1676449 [Lyophyllum atratum]
MFISNFFSTTFPHESSAPERISPLSLLFFPRTAFSESRRCFPSLFGVEHGHNPTLDHPPEPQRTADQVVATKTQTLLWHITYFRRIPWSKNRHSTAPTHGTCMAAQVPQVPLLDPTGPPRPSTLLLPHVGLEPPVDVRLERAQHRKVKADLHSQLITYPPIFLAKTRQRFCILDSRERPASVESERCCGKKTAIREWRKRPEIGWFTEERVRKSEVLLCSRCPPASHGFNILVHPQS